MILAEYDSPILEIPIIAETFRCVSFWQPPYTYHVNDRDWQYWDGVNSLLASDRLGNFLKRTGREVYREVLPKKKNSNKFPDKCGICHEVDKWKCVLPERCPASHWNRLCGHTDNACVYPWIECLLHILLIGWIISPDDFARHSAWLRVISKKLLEIDWMSKYMRIMISENRDKLRHIFWPNFYLDETISTSSEQLARNMDWQEMIGTRVDPYIASVVPKIQNWMMDNWSSTAEGICEKTARLIEAEIITTEKNFWIMSHPV